MPLSEERAIELAALEPPRSLDRLIRFLAELGERSPALTAVPAPGSAIGTAGANAMAMSSRVALYRKGLGPVGGADGLHSLMQRYQIGVAELHEFSMWLVKWNDKRSETEVLTEEEGEAAPAEPKASRRRSTDRAYARRKTGDEPEAAGAGETPDNRSTPRRRKTGETAEAGEEGKGTPVRRSATRRQSAEEPDAMPESQRAARREARRTRRDSAMSPEDRKAYREARREGKEDDAITRAWRGGRSYEPPARRQVGLPVAQPEPTVPSVAPSFSIPAPPTPTLPVADPVTMSQASPALFNVLSRASWVGGLGLSGLVGVALMERMQAANAGLTRADAMLSGTNVPAGGLPEGERAAQNMPLSHPSMPTASWIGKASPAPEPAQARVLPPANSPSGPTLTFPDRAPADTTTGQTPSLATPDTSEQASTLPRIQTSPDAAQTRAVQPIEGLPSQDRTENQKADPVVLPADMPKQGQAQTQAAQDGTVVPVAAAPVETAPKSQDSRKGVLPGLLAGSAALSQLAGLQGLFGGAARILGTAGIATPGLPLAGVQSQGSALPGISPGGQTVFPTASSLTSRPGIGTASLPGMLSQGSASPGTQPNSLAAPLTTPPMTGMPLLGITSLAGKTTMGQAELLSPPFQARSQTLQSQMPIESGAGGQLQSAPSQRIGSPPENPNLLSGRAAGLPLVPPAPVMPGGASAGSEGVSRQTPPPITASGQGALPIPAERALLGRALPDTANRTTGSPTAEISPIENRKSKIENADVRPTVPGGNILSSAAGSLPGLLAGSAALAQAVSSQAQYAALPQSSAAPARQDLFASLPGSLAQNASMTGGQTQPLADSLTQQFGPKAMQARPEMGQITLIAPPIQVASRQAEQSGVATSFDWGVLAQGAGPLDAGGLAHLRQVLPEGAQAIYPALPPGSLGSAGVNLNLAPSLLGSLLEQGYGTQAAEMAGPAARMAAAGGTPHAMPLPASIVPVGRPMGSQEGLLGHEAQTQGGAGALEEAGSGQAKRGGALDFLGMPIRLAPSLSGKSDLASEVTARQGGGEGSAGSSLRPELFSSLRDRLFPSFQSVAAEPDKDAWQQAAPSFGLRDNKLTTLLAPDARADIPTASSPLPQMEGGTSAAGRPFGLPPSLAGPMLNSLLPGGETKGAARDLPLAQSLSSALPKTFGDEAGFLGAIGTQGGSVSPSGYRPLLSNLQSMGGISDSAPSIRTGASAPIGIGLPAFRSSGAAGAALPASGGAQSQGTGGLLPAHGATTLSGVSSASPYSDSLRSVGSVPIGLTSLSSPGSLSRPGGTTRKRGAGAILSSGRSSLPISSPSPGSVNAASLPMALSSLTGGPLASGATSGVSGSPVYGGSLSAPSLLPGRSPSVSVPSQRGSVVGAGDTTGSGAGLSRITLPALSGSTAGRSASSGPGILSRRLPGSSGPQMNVTPLNAVRRMLPMAGSADSWPMSAVSSIASRAPQMSLPAAGGGANRSQGSSMMTIQRSTGGTSAATHHEGGKEATQKASALSASDQGMAANEVQLLAGEVWSLLKRRLADESKRAGRR